ncbi:MAG: hypothetical protein HXS54_08815, partial [Theionarchaea archaeon]|nr:hypothetical protein [Theionarchaea archaeon]
GELILESMRLSGTALEVCIRNPADIDVFILEEYRNGMLVERGLQEILAAKKVTCTQLHGTYSVGDEVILVTEYGTSIKFSVGIESLPGEMGGESGELIIESIHLSGGTLEVCIRNTGNSSVFITTVYRNGILVEDQLYFLITARQVTWITLPGEYAAGDDIMLVTEYGRQIRFTVPSGWIYEEPPASDKEGQVFLESMHLEGGVLTVCIRNNTDSDVLFETEYQNGILVQMGSSFVVPAQSTACFTLAGTYAVGDSVMIVTDDGFQIIFTVV